MAAVKLTELNPRWMGYGGEGVTQDGKPVPRREGVGLAYTCPCGKCATERYVGFANPLDGGPPVSRVAWQRTGDTFDTLTLTPSILHTLPQGCGWHGFITNGEVTSC